MSDGSVMVAELMVDVTQALQGDALPIGVADIEKQLQRLLAPGAALSKLAQPGVVTAKIIERDGPRHPSDRFARRLRTGRRRVQGGQRTLERLAVAALARQYQADADVSAGLTILVAENLVQRQRPPQVRVGLAEPACLRDGQAELPVNASLRILVAQPPGRGQRDTLGDDQIVPVAPHPEERRQAPGQLPGLRIEPGLSGLADHLHQNRALSVEPGQSLVHGRESFR